jgi:hypothetical protein
MKNWKVDIILHWKLFDVMEYGNGDREYQFIFLKLLFMKERTSYYIDNIGFGIDTFKSSKYFSVAVRMIAISLHFQKSRNDKMRLVA